MNTFFISPLIPLKFYVLIQKEKNNPNIIWTPEEINILRNINILFDYSKILLQKDKILIYGIIQKIINSVPDYVLLKNEFNFINHFIIKEIKK